MDVIMCRIYMTESEHKLRELLKYLKSQAQVRGVTVFRGIEGFGQSGEMHNVKFMDLSSDLPLVVEFFDIPETMKKVIGELQETIEAEHIVYWSATINE